MVLFILIVLQALVSIMCLHSYVVIEPLCLSLMIIANEVGQVGHCLYFLFKKVKKTRVFFYMYSKLLIYSWNPYPISMNLDHVF